MEPLMNQPPLTRRDMLALTVGSGVSFLLPGLDLHAVGKRGKERPKSLITVWLAGGPSQLETWDPHPGTKNGGPTKAIDTRIPGLKIAEFYPQVADEIDSLSVIRSLVSQEGDHERGTYHVKTGHRPNPALVHPSLGAIAAYELPDKTVEIPLHVSFGGGQWPARGGFLGARFDAFRIFEPGRNIGNMQRPVAKDRQKRRLDGLDILSREFRRGRRVVAERTLHKKTIDRALVMMNSDQLKAFRLDEETKTVRESYGDSRFGRGCLIARRLVEQGVRAVEVTLPGFDSHTGNYEAHRENAAMLDPALASLLRDLKQRDLLDSTVVLCIGEFGRTPIINPLEGRDHWPNGFSCLVGGGGLKSGVVIGETDPNNTDKKVPPQDPIEIADLSATVLQAVGVDPAKTFATKINRPIDYSDGTPIARLL
jgi:hypothetical protein